MASNVKLGVAVLGGYALGRAKKGRAALKVALWATGTRPRDVARSGVGRMIRSPQAAAMAGALAQPVLAAASRAAVHAFENRVNGLADSLQQRTTRLQGVGREPGEEPEGRADSGEKDASSRAEEEPPREEPSPREEEQRPREEPSPRAEEEPPREERPARKSTAARPAGAKASDARAATRPAARAAARPAAKAGTGRPVKAGADRTGAKAAPGKAGAAKAGPAKAGTAGTDGTKATGTRAAAAKASGAKATGRSGGATATGTARRNGTARKSAGTTTRRRGATA